MQVPVGWSLVGFSGGASVKVEAIFGNVAVNNIPNVSSNITSVWKWSNGGWQFWTPAMTSVDVSNYAASKGYQVLSDLLPGDGYWVNAKASVSLNDFAASSTKLGTFDVLRKVDINCHGYTFNPRTATVGVVLTGTKLVVTEDDFFDNRCVYTATTISSPLTGTFRCANNAFDEGTFTLVGDRQHGANDIQLVMDVVTTNRACSYQVKFNGFRQ
jgi:hypothetical protein